jgi:hypothetical protein
VLRGINSDQFQFAPMPSNFLVMGRYRFSMLVFAALASLAFATTQRPAKLVSFPSTKAAAVSPDGYFAVINVDSDAEPHHTLFLENRESKTRRKLMEYGRHVEVLWNPSSTEFAVNDYTGSNVAACLVFAITDGGPARNVIDAVQPTITDAKERATLRDSSHIYWVAVRWASPTLLVVKIWGHTDVSPSRGFQYFHTYDATNIR